MTQGRLSQMLLFVFCFAAGARAQSVPVKVLSQPESAFIHGFTRVGSVRELSNGSVIVLDVGDAAVHVIDATWATMSQIGRRGAGPREYRTPTRLFALPNDSSAVLDQQNNRLLVITPNADPGGFLNPRGVAGQNSLSAAGISLMPVSTADGRGFFFALANPIVVSSDAELRVADSAAVERWSSTDISGTRDTVGFVSFPLALFPGGHVFGGIFLAPRPGRIKAFKTWDQWAIGRDGRLATQ